MEWLMKVDTKPISRFWMISSGFSSTIWMQWKKPGWPNTNGERQWWRICKYGGSGYNKRQEPVEEHCCSLMSHWGLRVRGLRARNNGIRIVVM